MILYTVKTVLLLLVSLVALLAPLLIDAHHRWFQTKQTSNLSGIKNGAQQTLPSDETGPLKLR